MGTMERILRLMGEKQASDVYLAVNAPALIKINGECVPINNQLLPPDAPRSLLAEIVPAERLQELDETGELNMGVPLRGVGRFRVSAMHQRGSCAVVIRFIAQHIPPMDTLNLPPVLGELIMQKRGLLLVVGSTGSGKSTTLASMIDARNEKLTGHILTIEDPIEYQFRNKRSIVNQREVGSDTASLQVALKNALRQAPDVILIGEIRDRETMSSAMGFAQSGHLCLATLHANNSYHALNRILSFFPEEIRPTMLGELSAALKGVISQRLVRTVDGGRMPAVEVMLNTKLIADLIEDTSAFGWLRTSVDERLLALLDDPRWQPYIVFPGEFVAQERVVSEVVREPGKRPLFILLDATWTEARKMFRKSPYLDRFPVLSLQAEQMSRYRLRRSKRDDHFCTAEVAAMCLDLAGDTQASQALDAYLDVFSLHYLSGKRRLPLDEQDDTHQRLHTFL